MDNFKIQIQIQTTGLRKYGVVLFAYITYTIYYVYLGELFESDSPLETIIYATTNTVHFVTSNISLKFD